MRIILLAIPACLLLLADARRVQIRPRVTEPQIYYEEEDNQAAEDDFSSSVYQPRTRALPSPRSKDSLQSSKPPPVQTIRNYNKVNDDGSFTFGYEAADGSFKEETRGTDCVVRGKYGYVDPDGNKREFTYVSGNPCDPNAPKDDDDDLNDKQEDDELNGPANYPTIRPVQRPVRPTYHQPTTTRAPTTLFQNSYHQLNDDASQELDDEDVIKSTPLRPSAFRRPQTYLQVSTPSTALYEPSTTPSHLYRLASTPAQYQTTSAPVHRTQPTVSSTAYEPVETTTRRPVTRPRPQSVAITPRPHVAQVAAQYVSPSSTERPGLYYTHSRPASSALQPLRTSTPIATSSSPHLDFAAELERYVNTVGVQPSPKQAQQAQPQAPRPRPPQSQVTSSEPIYQSELVFDPATGQYNTQLYQTLPQTVGDFSLSHKLQPFVAQPQSLLGLQQLQQLQHQTHQQHQAQQQQQQQQQQLRQSPVYKTNVQSAQSAPSASLAQPQEISYRKQQTQSLLQSQHLYAQQQRRQQQQQQQQQQQHHQHQQSQAPRLQLLESQREPQSFYYVAPARSAGAGSPLSIGQIDQFLRAAAPGRY